MKLTNFARVARRTRAAKRIGLVDARGIVAARKTVAKVNLRLTIHAHVVDGTLANVFGGETVACGAVLARTVRLTQIDVRFAVVARVPSATRTVDGSVKSGATQAIVLACGSVAQVNERIAPGARVAVGAQTLEPGGEAETGATVEANSVGAASGRTEIDGRLTVAARIANRTIAVVAALVADTCGIVATRFG